MTDQKRPYASQTWVNGIGEGCFFPLQIIAKDLSEAIKGSGVAEDRIELWANDARDRKGFFVGDTSSLPAEGWTKLATL